MSLLSRIHTVWWFLRRPALYPQLIYQFYQSTFPHPLEDTRLEATEWCKKNSVSVSQAIKMVTGSTDYVPLAQRFHDTLEDANELINQIPVKMGGGADMELLFYVTESLKASSVIETGVAYGWSSLAFLLSLKNREGVLFSTDMPYAKMHNEDFVGCVVLQELRKFWKLISLPDRQALGVIEKMIKTVDMCHYDSDKSYRGRMWAYPKLWHYLRAGGILISDDINDNVAFRDFCLMLNREPMIIYSEPENKFIGLLIKSH